MSDNVTGAPRRSTHSNELGKPRFTKAYGFAIVTAVLFLLAWSGQFVAQMVVVGNEAQQHGQSFQWSDFWQAVGLAVLFLWGSSQSKESDERIEAKLDRLLAERGIDPDEVSRQVNSSL